MAVGGREGGKGGEREIERNWKRVGGGDGDEMRNLECKDRNNCWREKQMSREKRERQIQIGQCYNCLVGDVKVVPPFMCLFHRQRF